VEYGAITPANILRLPRKNRQLMVGEFDPHFIGKKPSNLLSKVFYFPMTRLFGKWFGLEQYFDRINGFGIG
jgi:hypothetical protein